jgi:nanoRNase/pAp phosphatase (c-di-AMP/oligoRNAs hydrolase)
MFASLLRDHPDEPCAISLSSNPITLSLPPPQKKISCMAIYKLTHNGHEDIHILTTSEAFKPNSVVTLERLLARIFEESLEMEVVSGNFVAWFRVRIAFTQALKNAVRSITDYPSLYFIFF